MAERSAIKRAIDVKTGKEPPQLVKMPVRIAADKEGGK
jgi:hypothetical protein